MISASNSYFTVLFIACCYLIYAHALARLEGDREHFSEHYKELAFAKEEATEYQHHLLEQLESQNDTIWLEWNLMRSLGLVPEGYTKVLFISAVSPDS